MDSDRLDIAGPWTVTDWTLTDWTFQDHGHYDRLDIDGGLDNDGQILSATTTDVRCRAVVIA